MGVLGFMFMHRQPTIDEEDSKQEKISALEEIAGEAFGKHKELCEELKTARDELRRTKEELRKLQDSPLGPKKGVTASPNGSPKFVPRDRRRAPPSPGLKTRDPEKARVMLERVQRSISSRTSPSGSNREQASSSKGSIGNISSISNSTASTGQGETRE